MHGHSGSSEVLSTLPKQFSPLEIEGSCTAIAILSLQNRIGDTQKVTGDESGG